MNNLLAILYFWRFYRAQSRVLFSSENLIKVSGFHRNWAAGRDDNNRNPKKRIDKVEKIEIENNEKWHR